MEPYRPNSGGVEEDHYSSRYQTRAYSDTPLSHLDLSGDLLASALRYDLAQLKAYSTLTHSQENGTLAEKVFGQQLEEKKASGRHLTSLLSERWKLYHDHIEELRNEINDLRNRLNMVARPYVILHPMIGANIERHLFRLESDARKEEIEFWKDSAEIRDKMLDVAHEYRKGVNRSRLFGQEELDSG